MWHESQFAQIQPVETFYFILFYLSHYYKEFVYSDYFFQFYPNY